MSFYESPQWTFNQEVQSPELRSRGYNYRKMSNNLSNLSTRKDSTDSQGLKFKYKTQVCRYWANGQLCPFEDICLFAHGKLEVRNINTHASHYRTKPCKNYENNGCCFYGTRCQFSHKTPKEKKSLDLKHTNVLQRAAENIQLFFVFSKRCQFFKGIENRQQPQQQNPEIFYQSSQSFEDNLSEHFQYTKSRLYSL